MATEIITSFQQICDANGDPLSGAKINVYAVTTTTPLSLFSNTGLSISAANPIITDSAGRHAMRYVATGSYKIVVTTSADVPVYERDNIDGRVPVGSGALAIANGGTGATSAGAALSSLGAATAAELADLAADVAALSGTLASSEKTHIATGTTAQRPGSPIEGDIRRNTTIPQWEGYVSGWKYFVTEDYIGTSATKLGYLNANKTDSGTNTFSGVNTFSNSAGVPARNTVKAFGKVVDGTLQAGSFNVASLTDNGTSHTITFTNAMANTEYAIIATIDRDNGPTNPTIGYHTVAAGSFRLETDRASGGSGANNDPDSYSFMVLSNE